MNRGPDNQMNVIEPLAVVIPADLTPANHLNIARITLTHKLIRAEIDRRDPIAVTIARS